MSDKMIASYRFETDHMGEQIDKDFEIKRDKRSVLYGRVLHEGCPVQDAVVKLIEVKKECKTHCECKEHHDYEHHFKHEEHKHCRIIKIPITHTFTDCNGRFILGPLCPDTCYEIKIYKNLVEIRCDDIECCEYDPDCLKDEYFD